MRSIATVSLTGRKVVYALKPSATLQPMEGSLPLRRGGAAPLFFQSVDHCLLSTIMMQTLCWTNIFHAPLGFPRGSSGKESACNVGDLALTPGLGRYPGEEKGYPLQYSGLENFMDCMVRGVTKSQTQLCAFHFTSLSNCTSQISIGS